MRSHRHSPHRRSVFARATSALIGAIACGALVATTVAPSHAAESGARATGAPVSGAVPIGDGISASVSERDGSLALAASVGGLDLAWNSLTIAAEDRHELGPGWGFGLTFLDVRGGVRVFLDSGRNHEMDASQPSGLAGYGVGDVVFTPVHEPAPTRAGDTAEPAIAAYRLRELGGVTTWFDERGNPIAELGVDGALIEWAWDRELPHRLLRVTDRDGVATTLDWDPSGNLTVRPASNLPQPAGRPERAWHLTPGSNGSLTIADPTGARHEVHHDAALPVRVSTSSGATTEIGWKRFDDGVPRVDRVVVRDEHGEELTARSWRPMHANLSSGWPSHQQGEDALFFANDHDYRYETELTSDTAAVRSTFTSLRTMLARETWITTGSGQREVVAQTFEYPHGEHGDFLPNPDALPGNWSRPTQVETTFRAVTGDARTLRETFEFDDFGRQIEATAPDGTITTTAYDDVVPGAEPDTEPLERALPIGLAVGETRRTPDGLVLATTRRLNEARTAVVATETRCHHADDVDAETASGTVTERIEYDVEPDGFVSAERVFPAADPDGAPLVTTRVQHVDLAAGERTVTETRAAGTRDAATTSTVTSLVHGGITAQTDAVGNETTTAYDELSRVVASTDAAGNTVETRYEIAQQHGRNATVTLAPTGVETTEERDELGRVERITDNIGGGEPVAGHVRVAEQRSYPDASTVSVTDAWGDTTTIVRDLFGRVVSTRMPTGLTEVTEYDDHANLERTGRTPTGDLDDAESVRITRRDVAGRATDESTTRVDGAAARSVQTAYDGSGRVASVTERRLETVITHDPFGGAAVTTLTPRPGDGAHNAPEPGTAPVPGATVTARRAFDSFGRSVSKTIAGDDGATTATGGEREHDLLGRVVSERDASDRTTRFGYTPDGLVATAESDHGQLVTHEYDAKTRRRVGTTTTAPTGPSVATVTEYDELTGNVLRVYDPGQRAATEITYTYDAFGNLLTMHYPDDTSISHTYDEHGRKRTTTDTAGRTTRFDYGPMGLITEAVQRDGAGEEAPELARVSYIYDAFARVERLERGNGTTTTFEFTTADEIARETTTHGDTVLADRSYEYDAEGLLVNRVDRILDGDELVSTTTSYEYDARGRLIGSKVQAGEADEATPTKATTYELGVTGDILTETTVSNQGAADPTTSVRTFEYAAAGELLAVTTDGDRRVQQYDAAGNVVSAADGTTFAFDAANRVVGRSTADGMVEVAYWADGTRRSQSIDPEHGAGAASTVYHWDGDLLIDDVHQGSDGSGGTASYLIGAGRHSRATGADTAYYIADRHGSITEVVDDAGAVRERSTYSDYGVATMTRAEANGRAAMVDAPERGASSSIGDLAHNPFGYSGEQTDEGWQYLRDRVYDTRTARLISEDVEPLIAPYLYGNANPIMNVDPTGHAGTPDKTFSQAMIGLSAVAAFATLVAILIPPAGFFPSVIAGYVLSGLSIAGHTYSIAQNAALLSSGALEPSPFPWEPTPEGSANTSKQIGAAAATFLSVVIGIAGAMLVRLGKAGALFASSGGGRSMASGFGSMGTTTTHHHSATVVSTFLVSSVTTALATGTGVGASTGVNAGTGAPTDTTRSDWLERSLAENSASTPVTNHAASALAAATAEVTTAPHPVADTPADAAPDVASASESADVGSLVTAATDERW